MRVQKLFETKFGCSGVKKNVVLAEVCRVKEGFCSHFIRTKET